MDGRVRTHHEGRGGLYHRPPASNMPDARRGFRAAGSSYRESGPLARIGSPQFAGDSGRDVPVLFLEQSEAGIDVAVGHLEQARRTAGAAVHDAVALRQRENVALLPADRLVADLAFA